MNNSRDRNESLLPRRGFLRLLALGAGAGLLSACQKALETLVQTPSQTPNPTPTGTATLTPTSTGTPTPTDTATVTSTPTPVVRAEPWERSREDQDKTLAQLMFPFVGGINHINRQGIDLRYGNLNIAIEQDSVIDPSGNVQPLRDVHAQKLNQNPQLLEQLASIHAQLEGAKNVTVVIQDGEITQVAEQPYQTITRYVLEDDGSLREMTAEEEPQFLPELTVDGPFIKRADTGEVVQFKGICIYSPEKRGNILTYTISTLENNERLGVVSNFLRISYDTTEITQQYLEKLLHLANYLAQNGVYLYLTPHRINGVEPGLPNDETIRSLNLLASGLKSRSNILYGILNEPGSHRNGNFVTWSELTPWINNTVGTIHLIFQELSKPIMVIPGTKWSHDFRQMPTNFTFPYAIDVHDYPWIGEQVVRNWWMDRIGKFPIIISELGNPGDPYDPQREEDIKYMQETFSIINNNPYMLHYSIWRGDDNGWGISWLGDGTYHNGKLTPRGEITVKERKDNPTQTDFTN